MARLYVLSGPELGRTHDFQGALVVGRGAEADLRLKAGSVSRRHARLVPVGEGWELEDLGSSNGTRLDGERVERTALRDGDVFLIGDVELRFRSDEGLAGTDLRRGPAASPAPSPAPAPPSAAAPAEGDGIELEGEWSAGPAEASLPLRSGPRPATPAARTPAPERTRDAGPTREQRRAALLGTRPSEAAASGGRKVLQYHKVEARRGLLAGDVGQQPTFVRWALYGLALLLFAALAYGAYRLTAGVRQARGADPAEDVAPGDG